MAPRDFNIIFEMPYDIDIQDPYDLARDCGIRISSDKNFYAGILTGDVMSEELAAAVFTTANSNDDFSFDVCVHPKYRRQGYGRLLTEIALDQYKEWREIFPEMELHVEAVNPIMAGLLRDMGLEVKKRLKDRVILGSFRLPPDDLNVIESFLSKEPSSSGKMLGTDGRILEKYGMGSERVARWRGNHIAVLSNESSKSDEVILRKLEKEAKRLRIPVHYDHERDAKAPSLRLEVGGDVIDKYQYNTWIKAYVPERPDPVGYVVYSSFRNPYNYGKVEHTIQMVEVDPAYRKQGIAAELYREILQREKISLKDLGSSMRTDLGQEFRDRLRVSYRVARRVLRDLTKSRCPKDPSMTQRVALRLLKQATVKVPPVMLKQAEDWVFGRYAQSVFRRAREVERKITLPNEEDRYLTKPISRDLVQIEWLRGLERTVATVREVFPDQNPYKAAQKSFPTNKGLLKVEILSDDDGRVSLEGSDSKTVSREKMSDVIMKMVTKHDLKLIEDNPEYINHLETFQRENSMTPDEAQEKLAQLDKIREMWRPHLGRDRGMKDSIPLNLDGWYFDLEDFAYAKDVPSTLGLELLSPKGKGFNAEFNEDLIAARFIVPDDILKEDQSERILKELARTVRHEMQHYAQYLLNLKDKRGRDRLFEPTREDEGKHHDVLDLEFDPIMQDEIDGYREWVRVVPKHLKPIAFRIWVGALKPSDKAQMQEFRDWMRKDRRHWLLERSTRQLVDLKKGRKFFHLLKDFDQDRWRKAVRILAKKVSAK